MSEATETPTVEHVSLGDNGALQLSDEAWAVMEGVEAPVLDEPAQAVAEPQPDLPKVETRKIKHNGQEVEIAKEQEEELIRKGFDYDYKRNMIEQERAKLAAYQGLVTAIETSPDIKAKVAAALGHTQPSVETQPQSFDDPIEQLKWEMRQEVLKEVEERYAKPFQQQMQMQQQVTTLERVRQSVQSDPQYKEVQAAIIEQIKAMPESVGKNLYLQLDQDPKAYMDMFQSVKQRLAKPTQQTQAQDTQLPDPVKRETKAPILEQGGSAEQESASQQKMNERIKDLTRRSKNGDYRATGELMNLLA